MGKQKWAIVGVFSGQAMRLAWYTGGEDEPWNYYEFEDDGHAVYDTQEQAIADCELIELGGTFFLGELKWRGVTAVWV